jgi:hypothetical protein
MILQSHFLHHSDASEPLLRPLQPSIPHPQTKTWFRNISVLKRLCSSERSPPWSIKFFPARDPLSSSSTNLSISCNSRKRAIKLDTSFANYEALVISAVGFGVDFAAEPYISWSFLFLVSGIVSSFCNMSETVYDKWDRSAAAARALQHADRSSARDAEGCIWNFAYGSNISAAKVIVIIVLYICLHFCLCSRHSPAIALMKSL